jgi:hypothetical protein
MVVMPDNIDKYIPEFDEEGMRARLSLHGEDDLLDMLVRAYKEKRVLAKLLDESQKKLDRIGGIVEEPSALLQMPGIPGPDDLKRLLEDDEPA